MVCSGRYGVWFELTQPLLRHLLPTAIPTWYMETAMYGNFHFLTQVTGNTQVASKFAFLAVVCVSIVAVYTVPLSARPL